jgi:hypothetical protein
MRRWCLFNDEKDTHMGKLILFTMLMMLSVSAMAQDTLGGIVWFPKVQISVAGQRGHTCDIAAGSRDTIHLIFDDISAPNGKLFKQPYLRSTNAGRSWEPMKDLIQDQSEYPYGYAFSNLAVDGNRVVIFGSAALIGLLQPTNRRLTYIASEDGGTTWAHERRIGVDSTTWLWSADVEGETMMIIYNPVTDNGDQLSRTLLSTDEGDTWFNLPDTFQTYQQVGALTPGGIHTVEDLPAGPYIGELLYKRTRDFQATYDKIDTLTEADGWVTPEREIISIPNDSGHTLILIWRDFVECAEEAGCKILVRESPDDGETWLPIETYTDIPNGVNPQIAAYGNMRAACWDQEVGYHLPTEVAVRVKKEDGTFTAIKALPGGGLGDIALTERGVHVAWEQLHGGPTLFTPYYMRGVFVEFANFVRYTPGWNLVSSSHRLDYSMTLPSLYSYASRYEKADSLVVGKGYWAKIESVVVYEGEPVYADTFEVQKGWNIIGSISNPVDVSTIRTEPEGIINSSLFGFTGGGYSIATVVEPGRGYWVKASQAGRIMLTASP